MRAWLFVWALFIVNNGTSLAESSRWKKPSRSEIEKRLTPLQCQVTQDGATEKPFQNEYWDNKRAGLYVDIVSGEPLFSSFDKYDSGSGWPSFTKPVIETNIVTRPDKSHGMVRTEIRSKQADSHLGHLFDDGPAPARTRYCVNSSSLRFIPIEKLEAEGYGEFRSLFMSVAKSSSSQKPERQDALAPGDFSVNTPPGLEVATLAGGCFWGMEDIIRDFKGVKETQVGYTGGLTSNPRYEDVKTGKTGHAEAVQILFDPKILPYEALLGFFFRMHDPTTMNRQGNDIGTQYRSVIFFYDESQRKTAEMVKERVDRSGKWKKPVVTAIEPANAFWRAEVYHQNYLKKNPGGYTCHYLRD